VEAVRAYESDFEAWGRTSQRAAWRDASTGLGRPEMLLSAERVHLCVGAPVSR